MTEIERTSNPYPGLRPFEIDEHHLFFGRDRQCDELLRQLRHHRFLAVVGSSGCGKSSLVKAGALPGLLGGQMVGAGSSWRVASLRPGSDPIGTLAAAIDAATLNGEDSSDEEPARLFTETTLRRGPLGLIEVTRQAGLAPGDNLLVLVDQLEELFRFTPAGKTSTAEDDPAAFVELLLRASRQTTVPIYVMVTMRSDYIGECARFRGLPEAINSGLFLVPRMTRNQLRAAITGPAAVAGTEVSSRLLQRLLGEASHDPDLLPVLQHVLMRTWDRRQAGSDGSPLDLPDYEAVGGIDHALSNHADEAYEELTDERAREIAERILKRLTEREAGDRDVRRPTRVDELCAVAEATEEQVKGVIETFRRPGCSFIMPPPDVPLTAETTVDISHESLMWGWQRLKRWVDQESRSARRYRRLAESTRLYREAKTGLMRDPELSVTMKWHHAARPNQAWAERYAPGFEDAVGFLEESREARTAEIAEQERAQQQELEQEIRRRKVLTRLLLALGTALVAAVVSMGIAWRQKAFADQRLVEIFWSNAAAATRQSNRLQVVHYLALIPEHDNRSRLLEPVQVGIQALSRVRLLDMIQLQGVTGVTLSPYSQHVLTLADDSTASLRTLTSTGSGYQLEPLIEQLELTATDARFKGGAFSESKVVTWADEGSVNVWLISNGSEVASISHDGCRTAKAAISRDGSLVATWCEGGDKVRLWDNGGTAAGTVLEHELAVRGAELSSDGARILTWGDDGYGFVCLWSTAEGRLETGVRGTIGRRIAGATLYAKHGESRLDDARILIWNDDGSAWICNGWGHNKAKVQLQERVVGAAFVDGRRFFLSWSDDGSARLWLTADGAPASAVMLHGAPVLGASIKGEDHTIWTCARSAEGQRTIVRIWSTKNLSGGAPKSTASADSEQPLTVSLDGSTARLQRRDGRGVMVLPHDTRVIGYELFTEDGLILTWSDDRSAFLWSIEDGTQVGQPMEHEDQVRDAMVTHEYQLVLTWCLDGKTYLWNMDGTFKAVLKGHQAPVNGARIVTDRLTGKPLVLTWSHDSTARLWYPDNGSPASQPMRHTSSVNGATVSPSGQIVMTWGRSWICLWHIEQGLPVVLAVLQPACEVQKVQFAAELQLQLTCSSSSANEGLLWDLESALDTPSQHSPLMVELTTGTRMGIDGHLSVISPEQWRELRNEYARRVGKYE